MLLSSYHCENFKNNYHWQKRCPRKKIRKCLHQIVLFSLQPAVVDFGGKQTPEQQLKDRQKFDVAKATIPKKGLIALTTQPETNKTEMKTFQFSGEMLLPNKGIVTFLIRHTQAPRNSHKGMSQLTSMTQWKELIHVVSARLQSLHC